VPTYTYHHKENDTVEDLIMSISEMEEFEKDLDAKGLVRVFDKSLVQIDRNKLMGGLKVDNVFANRLREIKKNHWGSRMNVPGISEV
jgi:hypothetical protein